MRVVIFLFVALALVLAVVTAESGFDRSNDPFMRLTAKIDASMIENSAKATVARASRLARVEADGDEESTEESSEDAVAEESSEDAVAEESSEDAPAAEDAAAEESTAEESTEESTEESSEESSVTQQLADEAAKAKANEDAAKAKAEALAGTVKADDAKLADAKAQVNAANQRAQAAQDSAAAASNANDSKARSELEAVRAQAEAQAKQTIEAATAQAKAMIDNAKARATDSCGDNCGKDKAEADKKKEWREVVLLKPTGADNKVDDQKLGLAPVMSVDTPTIRHAELVVEQANDFHEKFIDKHERDCQGSICPGLNFRVAAAL